MSDEINEITEEHSDYKPADARDESVKHQLTGMYQNWFLDYASYVILERAVVKSQIDCPFIRIHPEDSLWIQRPEKPRWLFYKHESLC